MKNKLILNKLTLKLISKLVESGVEPNRSFISRGCRNRSMRDGTCRDCNR